MSSSQPADDADGGSPPGPGRVRLLSYNTHLFKGTLLPGRIRSHLEIERATKIKEFVSDPELHVDIACFCEVWESGMRKLFTEDSVFPKNHFHMSRRWGIFLGNGLLIMSKYELINKIHIDFEHLVDLDKGAKKGALACCVRMGPRNLAIDEELDFDFRLFVTHTQAGDYPDQRKANLEEIVHSIQGTPPWGWYYPGTPAVVCGDFNVPSVRPPDSVANKEYREMMEVFNGFVDSDIDRNFAPTFRSRNTLVRRWEDDPEDVRLDYVLTKGVTPSEYRVLRWDLTHEGEFCDCSDHDPIMVDLTPIRSDSPVLKLQDTLPDFFESSPVQNGLHVVQNHRVKRPMIVKATKSEEGRDYVPVEIQFGNSAQHIEGDPENFKWIAFVRGEQVKWVRFHLHETMLPNEKFVTQPRFELEGTGWGVFTILMVVTLIDGRVVELRHFLEADDGVNRHEVVKTVIVE